MNADAMSELAKDILRRLMQRAGVKQACVFNSEGDPFWAGRWPLDKDELALLDVATTLPAESEKTLLKPFLAADERGRFSAAALEADTDLYLVLFHGPFVDEARLVVARREALELLHPLRSPELRLALLGAA